MDESELSLPGDDFDAFNDETFGDGDEYNWEAAQALNGDLFADISNGNRLEQPKSSEEDKEAANIGGGRAAFEEYDSYEGQSREVEYDDFENNENALEESISRLVLDDFEDDESLSNDKLRRIASTGNRFAHFMPPQVVNRHLQWFMEKDLPGGNSLLGSSVWSMHPTSITPKAAENDLNSSKLNNYISLMPSDSSPRNHLDGCSTSANALPTGSDLDNLLGLSKLKEKTTQAKKSSPGLNNIAPAFKTVDEIEQELLRESDARQKVSEPSKNYDHTKQPNVISVEDLERELRKSPAIQTPVLAQPSGPATQVVPPSHPQRSQYVEGNRMSLPFGAQPSNLSPQVSLSTVPITPNSDGLASFAVHSPNARPIQPRPTMRPPNSYAQNIAEMAAHQAVIQQLQHLRHQQQLRFLQQQMQPNHVFRPVGLPDSNQRNNIGLMLGFPSNSFHINNAAPHVHLRQHKKTEDRDEGLMNEKDKQRLKNIQIVQLQNDHPHTTDYYCLMRRVRLGGCGHPPMDLLRMLFPRRTGDDDNNRRQYEPAHFENSLGKLQAQSALAPRKAIDTVIRVIDAGPVAGKKKSYRYLLLEIEKLYDCLLALEEADLRVALKTSGGEEDRDIKAIRTKVENILRNPVKLTEIMSVRKGKVLVCRLVALVDQPLRTVALLHLFKNFPTWSTSGNAHGGKGSPDLTELFPYVRHCILTMDSRTFEAIVAEFKEDLIDSMVVSKLGMSILMVLLHQGEKLMSNNANSTPEKFKNMWSGLFVIPVLTKMLRQKQKLAFPIEIYNCGLERLLTSNLHRLNLQVKEELTRLLNDFLNAGSKLIKQDY